MPIPMLSMSRSGRRFEPCATLPICCPTPRSVSPGAPEFKVDGKTIAGFVAYKNHLSYLPHLPPRLARRGAC